MFRLLNVLVPETDKVEVSVFVMLLPDDKLGVESLARWASKVALIAVKLKIKKCQFKTLLTVFTVTEKSCFIGTQLIWNALS